jgi:hypothetical protein
MYKVGIAYIGIHRSTSDLVVLRLFLTKLSLLNLEKIRKFSVSAV